MSSPQTGHDLTVTEPSASTLLKLVVPNPHITHPSCGNHQTTLLYVITLILLDITGTQVSCVFTAYKRFRNPEGKYQGLIKVLQIYNVPLPTENKNPSRQHGKA